MLGDLPDVVQVERMRAAASAEISHEEVKPIRSDYHFFVKANMAKFKALAEEEVQKSMKPGDKKDMTYFVNTNLNTRLKHAWEIMGGEEREIYATKEEEDRRRFMEEDEIASRHCATLTARGEKPIKIEKEGRESIESDTSMSAQQGHQLPPGSSAENPSQDNIKEESSELKRQDPPKADGEEEATESPQKKTRQSEDEAKE